MEIQLRWEKSSDYPAQTLILRRGKNSALFTEQRVLFVARRVCRSMPTPEQEDISGELFAIPDKKKIHFLRSILFTKTQIILISSLESWQTKHYRAVESILKRTFPETIFLK